MSKRCSREETLLENDLSSISPRPLEPVIVKIQDREAEWQTTVRYSWASPYVDSDSGKNRCALVNATLAIAMIRILPGVHPAISKVPMIERRKLNSRAQINFKRNQ